MATSATRKSLVNNFRKYPPVLTVKEVCEILGLGSTKVYALIRSGEIERIEKSGLCQEKLRNLIKKNTAGIPRRWRRAC